MKHTYDDNDEVVLYFVIKEGTYGDSMIKAWTDDKDLLNAYMEFHSCKQFRVKKIRKRMKDFHDILNENLHDEIDITNIITRGKNGPGFIAVPMTTTEIIFLDEETKTYLSMNIDYTTIDEAFYYFKEKYQDAFKKIGLRSVIDHVIYNKPSAFVQDVVFDQAIMLSRTLSDDFGV